MEWIAIAKIVIELIEGCNKRDGAATVRQRVRRPGLLERFALRNALQKAGLRGAELHATVDSILDLAANATDQELEEFLASKL